MEGKGCMSYFKISLLTLMLATTAYESVSASRQTKTWVATNLGRPGLTIRIPGAAKKLKLKSSYSSLGKNPVVFVASFGALSWQGGSLRADKLNAKTLQDSCNRFVRQYAQSNGLRQLQVMKTDERIGTLRPLTLLFQGYKRQVVVAGALQAFQIKGNVWYVFMVWPAADEDTGMVARRILLSARKSK
jgi:hypothetical protein